MPKTARLWLTAPSVVMTLASRAGLQLGVAGYQPATTVTQLHAFGSSSQRAEGGVGLEHWLAR